jgi:hypothetical protein
VEPGELEGVALPHRPATPRAAGGLGGGGFLFWRRRHEENLPSLLAGHLRSAVLRMNHTSQLTALRFPSSYPCS